MGFDLFFWLVEMNLCNISIYLLICVFFKHVAF